MMGQKLVVGPFGRGLRKDVTAFNVDNDNFPKLLNAYQWRGRIKRKRGTSFLCRLRRYFSSTVASYSSTATITLSGGGAGNLLTGFLLETNGSIVPGTVTITAPGPVLYTDPAMDGNLSPSGTINYATGAIVILAEAGNAVSAIFTYYPNLPNLGLEDLSLTDNQFPTNIGFDTTYAYNITPTTPSFAYDVSFYKNPLASASLPGYTQKASVTPVTWNGQNYQQFWSTNYENAFWATNGISVPFTTTNIGMQFKAVTNVTNIVAGPPATCRLAIAAHGLSIGDFLFLNEIGGVTGINFQTCYVTGVPGAGTVDVEFPSATLGGAYTSGGIAQYLTNRSSTTKDCMRWYDGDPTNGSLTAPLLTGNKGWVNFCPPLSQDNFSIGGLPPAKYYLVTARMVVPFKDRLLFIGPVVQTNGANSQVYLSDTVIYSQNGTPFYTATFTGSAALATTSFTPLLIPTGRTATPNAYWCDTVGFGGFVSAGVSQPINTVSSNEDVLIMGLSGLQTRFVFTGNDINPFLFYLINSEYGSGSTFSTINLDKGVLTRGSKGYILTSQVETGRFDLDIPDEIFQVNYANNGQERVCAQRDYINEWVYFTYLGNTETSIFPNETLQYNYREESWGVFKESYTTYGAFRRTEGYTWATIGLVFPSWSVWNEPWSAGSTTRYQPTVIAGNQQGFILQRDDGTGEGDSLSIRSFSSSTVTSIAHGLESNDYIIINGCIGTIGAEVNGKIFSVKTITNDTFTLNPDIGAGTYFGGGTIRRLYVPSFQTKQFPLAWDIGRKTRLGVQQYLLTTTERSQITLLIYLSQDGSNAYNEGLIIPDESVNGSLIYSSILYTCPESANLGLTPANTSLQMIAPLNPSGTNAASPQQQIWHRVNTSLLGDTVQVGFTMSDAQMRQFNFTEQVFDVTGATQAYPCVLTCDNSLSPDYMVYISGIDEGMTQLNSNQYAPERLYQIISATDTTVTINIDSTAFDAYTAGGTLTVVYYPNIEAEIELHGMILDVSPSQLLA